MMEPPVASMNEALTALAQLLRSSDMQQRQPEDVRYAAIRKVWQAVDTTRTFLASGRDAPERLAQPNRELAELWSEASLAVSAFDLSLAYRLRYKAEYWSDPWGWDVRDVDIGIDSVAEAARALIAQQRPIPAIERPHARVARSNRKSLDIFISHASEDNDAIANPLATALRNRGYRVWYDNFNLQLGDNLRYEIDRGLSLCRYTAVILSPNYVSKPWTNLEFDGLIGLEVSKRQKRILPILHGLEQDDVVSFSPILSGRLSISTSIGVERVVEEVVKVLDYRARRPRTSRTRPH